MKYKPQALVYTILAAEQPVVAIEAMRTEARELCKEEWFLEELSLLKWKGQPLYKPGMQLRARPATEDEWLRYDEASKQAGGSEDILFVYLVDLEP
jgi:hypothetical protein